jgi:stalled ribosome alternative rescue factor ArfA
LDYYDISEGLFSSFTPEDYTRINQRAKDLIRDNAMKSSLLSEADAQGAKMLDLVRFMVEGRAGSYKLAAWKKKSGNFENKSPKIRSATGSFVALRCTNAKFAYF